MHGAQPSASTRYCSRCLTTFEEDHERCPNLSCRRGRPQAGWGRMYGAGDVFDRHYKIHSLLALGGAGVTYLAREVGVDGEEIGPRLALKVLFASRDEGPYLKRLATEAQVLQELDHPNIVQYLGFVHRAGHSPYLVTRFEPGGSLLDHIKRVGSLPVRRAAQVARQVCWALDKAHDMGVVHRDLKPENVLLARVVGGDEDAVVRVADFGIAKVLGSLGSQTRVGAFVGTPQYAAPEQFIGGAPTPATDVYGVGALLYFCTMVLPVVRFADRLAPEEGYQLLVDALPPVVVRSHDDADDVRRLNRLLELCMDPDPTRRCSAEQLDGLLAALLAGREPDVDAVRPTPTRSSPTLAAPDPDTQEKLRALRSDPTTPLVPAAEEPAPVKADADGGGTVGALGVLAGVAAGAAVGAAAGWLASKAAGDDD
ncbi:serine/threonine protein kinase, partial [Myxococcota bacterium]|nr:serine/threonine protein kinase [Myxococcota bacterium]